MKPKRAPDIDRVRKWPEFYWNLAGIVCACLPTAAAILVSLGVLTVRTAVIATVAGIAYVFLTTWRYTRQPKPPETSDSPA